MITSVKFDKRTSGRAYFLATASTDGHCKLWSNRDFSICHQLVGHEKAINDLSVSEDGELIVTASGDRTWKLWAHLSYGVIPQVKEEIIKEETGVKLEDGVVKLEDGEDVKPVTNGVIKIEDDDDDVVIKEEGTTVKIEAGTVIKIE